MQRVLSHVVSPLTQDDLPQQIAAAGTKFVSDVCSHGPAGNTPGPQPKSIFLCFCFSNKYATDNSA